MSDGLCYNNEKTRKQVGKVRNESQQNNPLGHASIMGLILKFAIPSIVSMLVSAMYNLTDQIFIGNVVGMLGNAATNVAFPMVILTNAFAQMMGIGTAANFNINMGAGKTDDAQKYVHTGFSLMALVGIVIGSLVFFLRGPILMLCGATETVYPYAYEYLSITALGIPFLLCSSASSYVIRADGSPSYSMLCTVSGAILNVGLDALFMFSFGWGIRGAALATVAGQVFSAVMCLFYLPRFKSFSLKLQSLGFRKHYVLGVMKLGLSNFINQTIMMLVNIVLNNMLRRYGGLSLYGSDIPLAVSGVAAKLNSILASCTVGLSMGCQPIWSFNTGAKQFDRVKKTYKTALLMGLCLGLLIFSCFQVFPRQIVGIFGSGEPLYYEFAEKYLRVYMMFVFLHGIQPMTVNYFTGSGNVKNGVIISLSRQGFFLLPMLLVFPLFFGVDGILYAGACADLCAALLCFVMITQTFRRLPTSA